MPEDVQVGEGLVAALEATVHRVLERLRLDLAALGLTAGEVNALAQLRPGLRRTAAQLGQATGQRPSTLTGVLDRLERRGLVRRQPNPGDRRSFTVEVTADGAAAAAAVAAAFARLEAEVVAAAGAGPVAAFRDVLRVVDGVAARPPAG